MKKKSWLIFRPVELTSVFNLIADKFFGLEFNSDRKVKSSAQDFFIKFVKVGFGKFRMSKNGMNLDFLWPIRLYRSSLVLLSVGFLQACAIPGFGLMPKEGSSQLGANAHILGYKPVTEISPDDSDEIPSGAVTNISPGLIRELQRQIPLAIPPEVQNLFGPPPVYSIGPGDVVGIVVYDHPELLPSSGAVISQQSDPTGVSVAPGFIVNSSGEISFPYVGRVKLQGLTEIDASDLIARRIATYIREPQVTVRIQAFRSQRAYVEGEVKTPGLQIFTDVPMTLAEAISRAGGITPTGDRSFVTLTRGKQTTILNLPYLQERGSDASNIPLKNGDVINVRNREESKVYVMGEVLRPSALLMRNGKLSLNEALGESGGPNLATSNPGQIYVIRNSSAGTPEIFHLDAKNPASLALADRFSLLPRDVVYIDPVPLVQWSRLINLIIPAASVVYYGSQSAK